MPDKSPDTPQPAKPASHAEQQAAEASTKDGLQPGQENSKSRQRVREQKTPQGQPNRG